jgi:2,3,4,5-tetrahydropyridine-2-carboxylate N-succinyltransferase
VTDLSRYPDIAHLVLLRAHDAQGQLLAVIPHLPAHYEALRVLMGAQDRDGQVTPAAAKTALQALAGMGKDSGNPVAEVLKAAQTAAQPVKLTAIACPVPRLLERLSARKGTKEDTLAFVELLNAGDVRAAEKVAGRWQPQPYVIDGILNFFGVHEARQIEPGFWDKVPLKTAGWSEQELAASGVRFAPGCRVRTGCYIGAGTVIMNQAFVNIGAYIAGQGVMVDVSARVASCAQIGKGVKFGAGSGIEGILEPAGRLPSIIEDHAKVGAMCEVSGILSEGSVLASGVVMASGKKIYDEATGKVVPPLAIRVGETTYQVPVIPPYRLAVGGSLLNDGGKTATDAVILKPGDLRDGDTLRHFEKQGILYP